MLFSSITFLYYFLPCVILLYYLTPKKLKNLTLLLSSLVFYAWGEPKYVILMAVGIINGYASGLLIEKFIGTKKAKAVLWISALISIGSLGYFKYADFFIENINAATGVSIPLLKIALPVGISFYTFQILSYTIDVYRKDVKAQRSFIDLAAYVSMFPQLIAGPIVRYSDVAVQLKERTHSFDKAAAGIRIFVVGLGKKVLIANALGELCNAYSADKDNSVLLCWMYAFAYSLQIYFDFSGYSDMAVGLGRIFGFELCENFHSPFISQSITEFWRRWHISLGTWFRDYVYIPLGGNRVSKLGHIRNILVVWMLTGFWHGAAWNFIIWGLYFALFLMLEKFFLLGLLKKTKVIGHVYVLLAVLVSFVIFGSDNISSAAKCLGGMFGIRGLPFASSEQMYYLRSFSVILIMAVIGATPLLKKLIEKISVSRGEAVIDIIEPIFLVGITVLSTAYLVDGSFNPFMYFRF